MKYTSAQDGRDILFSFRNDCLQSILCLKKFCLEIIFYKIGRFCYGKLYTNFNPLSFFGNSGGFYRIEIGDILSY